MARVGSLKTPWRSLTVAFAAILVMLVPDRSHGEARPPFGGKVVGSLSSAPSSVDPLFARSHAELTLVTLVFDSLYREGVPGSPKPHLAAALPTFSADGLEARVLLKVGVYFHDGRPVRAIDALWSLRRAAKAREMEWALAPVKGITRDGETIVFSLHRPAPELASLLALPQLAITPAGRPPKASAPVGSGPFRVRRLAFEGRRLELVASEDHFGGRPFVDEILLRWFDREGDEARAYEAGEADFSFRGAVAFAGHSPKHPTSSVEGEAVLLAYLGFGKRHGGLLADRDFRRAVSLALNRGSFRHVGAGERVIPTSVLGPPGSKEQAGVTLVAQPEAARATLRQVQSRLRLKAMPPLEIMVDRTRLDDADVAARVLSSLDRIGLNVVIRSVEPPELARRVAAGDCDLYVSQLVSPSRDPLHERAMALSMTGDPWAASRLRKGDLALATYTHAFLERLPIVPIYYRTVRVHFRKALRGFTLDGNGTPELAGVYWWED